MAVQPTPEDQFSFGLWTVGWQARDPFGDATRPPLDPVETVHRLAELGAYGVTFHDDDLIPFGSRRRPSARSTSRDFEAALDETGPRRADGDDQPVHPPGVQGRRRSPATTARSAATRCARSCATSTSPRELGAQTYVFWGGREGAETDVGEGRPRRRSTATARASTCWRSTSIDRGYEMRFALEPKPNEPRGDILLPTVGARARRSSRRSSTTRWSGVNPEVGHEQMAGLNFVHGIAQALVAGQALPHRPQRPARHQVRPGPRVRPRRPAQRVLPRRPARERRHRGRPRIRRPAPLRLQAAAHRGHRRRVGLGCGEHAHLPAAEGAGGGVPCRPRGAGGAGRCTGRRAGHADARRGRVVRPTCSPTAQRSRTSTPTPPASGATASPQLDQLAVEHLLGAR